MTFGLKLGKTTFGKTTLGMAIAVLKDVKVVRATLRLTKAGKTALRKAAAARGKAATLTLTASAKDAAGNAASRTTRLVCGGAAVCLVRPLAEA